MLPLLCACAVGVLLWAEGRGHGGIRAVAKTLASLAFVLAGLAGEHPGAVGTAILLGLAGGAVGDVLLLSRDKRGFLAGLVAFLLAHVAYGVAFVVAGTSGLVTMLVGVGLVGVGVGVWRWIGPHTGSLAPAVMAYIVVITAMVALAAGTGRPAWGLAAVMFFVSDLAVARERFVVSDVRNKLVGLPLYYAAQLLFATS